MNRLNLVIATLSSPRIVWLVTLLTLLALALAAGAPDGGSCGSSVC
jgi:hypothetical protein